ncbi:unnamed protein product [Haemonchus placei]|uniref:Reverse transcriptase n=1 Tax=Haemonchus placei TaxID=6290 RepID=A0A158QQU8_HAEPC|nr:unnamed protein product [Haemonchus placei]
MGHAVRNERILPVGRYGQRVARLISSVRRFLLPVFINVTRGRTSASLETWAGKTRSITARSLELFHRRFKSKLLIENLYPKLRYDNFRLDVL